MGSLPPPAIALGLMLFFDAGAAAINIALGAILLLSSALCVLVGRYAEERFLRKDAAEVVIDETAGQCLPLLFLPIGAVLARVGDGSLLVRSLTVAALCALAFLLFRVFDILKPWPARRLESLPHGWGVLADDLMAGLYAAIVMQLSLRVIL